MKKPKRKLSKAERSKRARERREQNLLAIGHTLEELLQKLNALGDFDANAPHVRCLAAALVLLYRDRLGVGLE